TVRGLSETLDELRAECRGDIARLHLGLADELGGKSVLQKGSHDGAAERPTKLTIAVEEPGGRPGQPRLDPPHCYRGHRRKGATEPDAGQDQGRQEGELARAEGRHPDDQAHADAEAGEPGEQDVLPTKSIGGTAGD